MQTLTETDRKTLERKARIFLERIETPKREEAVLALVNLLEPIHSEVSEKVDRSELKEILLEIRSLREDMNQRFEDMQRHTDKRFEDMQSHTDKRFEDMQSRTDKRFEDMQHHADKRFEDIQRHADKRFEDMQHYMEERFGDINKRFEDINKRFEDMNKRFEDMQRYMDKRFIALQWTIGIAFFIISIIMPVSTSLILKLL